MINPSLPLPSLCAPVQANNFIVSCSQSYNIYIFLLGDELENVTESIVSEGLVEVRRGGIKPSE